MSSWRKTAWCTRCAAERPVRKATVGKDRGRYCCVTCGDRVLMPSKLRNVPTVSKHTGRTFQSKHEANREPTLLALQNAGAITDLKYQVPFPLEVYGTQAVDALLAILDEVATTGRGLSLRTQTAVRDVRRSRQLIATYKADFAYRQDGRLVVEDPKGYAKPEYRMKKKLMVAAHNIEILEPTAGGIEQRARGAGIHGHGTGYRLAGGR